MPLISSSGEFLQHLQAKQGRRRWILKCPDHAFGLADLRVVFPDARIIFVHRDPLQVLASVVKLTEVLRRPFSHRVDPREIGRQDSAQWLDGSNRMIQACTDCPFIHPICQVHFTALVAHPLRTIAAVYKHFGLEMDDAAAQRIAIAVARQSNGGYRSRPARLADYGIDTAVVRERFRHYIRFFGIETRDPM